MRSYLSITVRLYAEAVAWRASSRWSHREPMLVAIALRAVLPLDAASSAVSQGHPNAERGRGIQWCLRRSPDQSQASPTPRQFDQHHLQVFRLCRRRQLGTACGVFATSPWIALHGMTLVLHGSTTIGSHHSFPA